LPDNQAGLIKTVTKAQFHTRPHCQLSQNAILNKKSVDARNLRGSSRNTWKYI